MTGTLPSQARLSTAKDAILAALDQPFFRAIAAEIPQGLRTPADCFEALALVTTDPHSTDRLDALRGQSGFEAHMFERWILSNAFLAALPKIADAPVVEGVKDLWGDEGCFLAEPPDTWLHVFSLESVRFREMARLVTMRRFPAGQFHWELTGLPRSILLRTPLRDYPGLLGYVLRHPRELQSFAEVHVNARRRNRLTLSQAEASKSYYLLARSLATQPSVNGLLTASWIFCKSNLAMAPRLVPLRTFFEENGAFIGNMGPAPEDSGFLVGSEERRRVYEEGSYQPQMTYVLWPRREMLKWADRYERQSSGPLG